MSSNIHKHHHNTAPEILWTENLLTLRTSESDTLLNWRGEVGGNSWIVGSWSCRANKSENGNDEGEVAHSEMNDHSNVAKNKGLW